jgi:hypothetical protein
VIAVSEHLMGKHVGRMLDGKMIAGGRVVAVAFDSGRTRFVFLVATAASDERRFETWGDEEVRMQ